MTLTLSVRACGFADRGACRQDCPKKDSIISAQMRDIVRGDDESGCHIKCCSRRQLHDTHFEVVIFSTVTQRSYFAGSAGIHFSAI